MSKLSSGTVQIILTDDDGVKSSEVGVKMANDINAGNSAYLYFLIIKL